MFLAEHAPSGGFAGYLAQTVLVLAALALLAFVLARFVAPRLRAACPPAAR